HQVSHWIRSQQTISVEKGERKKKKRKKKKELVWVYVCLYEFISYMVDNRAVVSKNLFVSCSEASYVCNMGWRQCLSRRIFSFWITFAFALWRRIDCCEAIHAFDIHTSISIFF